MAKRAMTQVSTNLTLFFKLFVPVFFTVFVGAVTGFLWLNKRDFYANLSGDTLRLLVTSFFVGSLVFMIFTVWRLRRVEMSRDWVYVTDYFRQARYPWTNIERVHETSLGALRLVNVYFYEPGSFGERATFLASASRWRLFKEEYPDRLAKVMRKG